MWGLGRRPGKLDFHMIRPSHLSVDGPSTPSRVKQFIPACLEGKFSVGLTHQTSNAEITRNMETDVRNGGSNGPESSKFPTDRGRG